MVSDGIFLIIVLRFFVRGLLIVRRAVRVVEAAAGVGSKFGRDFILLHEVVRPGVVE